MRALLVITLALFRVSNATPLDWQEYPSNPVYNPGKAYYPTVLESGGAYTMWSDGATGLQVATSPDGIHWTTIGQASGLTNPRHAVVENVDGEYRIWYWDNSMSYSISDVRTATSSDGIVWTDDKPLTQSGTSVVTGVGSPSLWNAGSYGPVDILYNPLGSSSIVAPLDGSSVWANRFVMYYDGTTGGDESVGLAVSSDGVFWWGYNDGVAPVLDSSTAGWDSGYVGFGTVIRDSDNAFEFWYSGGELGADALNQGIGYAVSTDGIHWTKDANNPIFYIGDGAAWRSGRTYTPMVIGNQMWFSGVDANGHYAVGYAEGSIPEPGTAGLLLLGGLALLAFRGVAIRRARRAIPAH